MCRRHEESDPATLIILTEVKVCWGHSVTAEGFGPQQRNCGRLWLSDKGKEQETGGMRVLSCASSGLSSWQE